MPENAYTTFPRYGVNSRIQTTSNPILTKPVVNNIQSKAFLGSPQNVFSGRNSEVGLELDSLEINRRLKANATIATAIFSRDAKRKVPLNPNNSIKKKADVIVPAKAPITFAMYK